MTDPADEELLEALGRVIDRTDPVPRDVGAFARAALGWRRVDELLAELLGDSAVDREAGSVRSGEGERWLSFTAEGLEIVVQVTVTESGTLLRGQLAPPAPATVHARDAEGSWNLTTEADEHGRFLLGLADRGLVRLAIKRTDRSPVVTSWFEV